MIGVALTLIPFTALPAVLRSCGDELLDVDNLVTCGQNTLKCLSLSVSQGNIGLPVIGRPHYGPKETQGHDCISAIPHRPDDRPFRPQGSVCHEGTGAMGKAGRHQIPVLRKPVNRRPDLVYPIKARLSLQHIGIVGKRQGLCSRGLSEKFRRPHRDRDFEKVIQNF